MDLNISLSNVVVSVAIRCIWFDELKFHRSCLHLDQRNSQQDKQKFFISKATWYSIEINIHTLTSIVLLILRCTLPEYAFNIHLFSSQTCEATFRNARALTGTFSSITNFSVHQLMSKTQKLSLLNKIRSREESNDSCYSLKFPMHHKNNRSAENISSHHHHMTLKSINDIEKIIFKAY